MKMKTLKRTFNYSSLIRGLAAAGVASVLGSTALFADIVYVTARVQPSGAGANQDGTYSESTSAGGSIVLSDTGAKASGSAVADAPARGGGRAYLTSAPLTDTAAGFSLRPTLEVVGGVYLLECAFNASAGNINTNSLFTVSSPNCTLNVATTDKFQRQYGNNTWQTIGFLTNALDSSAPIIDFTYESGFISSATGANSRLLLDVFKFTLVRACLGVRAPAVNGLVGADQSSINVAEVTNATKVTVYQDSGGGMVPIGSKTNGLVDGVNSVPVTGLVKGAKVAATQTVGGQESCVPLSGLMVGGGANTQIRVALSVREAPDATGPAGTNAVGLASSNIHFLGATNTLINPYTPADGLVVYPSNEWQTITWQRGEDPANPTNGTVQWFPDNLKNTLNNLQGQWGTLESIAFVIDDLSDTGPFDIYVDNISNGTNGILQDFEGAVAGRTGFVFNQPSFSGTTSAYLLGLPNDAVVSSGAADTGTKSMRVRFQFASTNDVNWVRFNTSNSDTSAPHGWNPLLDLNQPISIRMLIQPVGVKPTPPLGPTLSIQTDAGNAVLNWTGAHNLQQASEVTGPYTNVTGVTIAPYTNAPTETQKFFRLAN